MFGMIKKILHPILNNANSFTGDGSIDKNFIRCVALMNIIHYIAGIYNNTSIRGILIINLKFYIVIKIIHMVWFLLYEGNTMVERNNKVIEYYSRFD